MLCLKSLSPTRLVRNALYTRIAEAEAAGQASPEQLRNLLGTAAAKRGIFEGDTDNGELEIGQSAAYVHSVMPVADIMRQLMDECARCRAHLCAAADLL